MILLLDESLYKRNFINSLRNSNNTDIAAFIDCTKKKKKFWTSMVHNTQNSMELFQLVQEQDRTRIETQTPSDQRSIGFDGVAWRGMKSFGFVRKREREREYSFANSSPNNSEANSMVVSWNSGRTKGSPGSTLAKRLVSLPCAPSFPFTPVQLHPLSTCRGWLNACSCGWIKEWTMAEGGL